MSQNPIIKKGYKQTEIGVIPEDWEVKKLNSLSYSISSGKSKIKSNIWRYPLYWSTWIIWYTDDLDYQWYKILIARVGANAWMVNRVRWDYWVSDNTLILDLKWTVNIDYIYYKLQKYWLNRMVFGSWQPLITWWQLKELCISLPELDEQSAIASILSDTDALIANLDKLIEKKKAIKQGMMQELLTGKRRFPGFSGEWKIKKLWDLASFFKGKWLPKSSISESWKYKCIHYGELFTQYSEEIQVVKSYTDDSVNLFYSRSNDVLMPTSDVTPNWLAKASAVKEDWVILWWDVMVIRTFEWKMNWTFLAYSIRFHKDQVMQLVSGSTVYHLYWSDMKKFEFKLPPTLEEQDKIVNILNEMSMEIANLEIKRDKLQKVKQGMMQQLLTGNIRVYGNQ